MKFDIRQGQEQDRLAIADTIVEAFYHQFKALTTDKQGVRDGLAPMLHPQRFFVAVDGQGDIIGTVGLGDEQGYALTIMADVLRKALGFVKGNVAAIALKEEFYRPKAFQPGQAHLDFVAVRESHRRQGVARQLVQHVLNTGAYTHYTLEVLEGSEYILPLYQQLGFVITGTEKERASALKGFSFRHLLRRDMK